jgi:hypothetical protein
MDKELICGDKYQFFTKNKIIGLPVKLENLPNKIEVEGNSLLLRSSFHVSLVCIGKIIEKYNIFISDFENKIINDFCEFVKTNEVKVLQFNDFKFVARDEKKTVVVMCKVSNLDNFFYNINKKYKLEIEYPPTHVTLYTLDGKSGIFLTNANDIKNLTKSIPNPIGHPLEF